MKLDNVLRKLDLHLNKLIPITIETSNRLEDENRVLREEIIRLERIQRDLIHILAKRELKKKEARG